MQTAATSIFTYFLFYITKQNKTGSIKSNCYSTDHIAEDHIHTDITCNTGEAQQKSRLGTVSNRLLVVGGGAETSLLDPNLAEVKADISAIRLIFFRVVPIAQLVEVTASAVLGGFVEGVCSNPR